MWFEREKRTENVNVIEDDPCRTGKSKRNDHGGVVYLELYFQWRVSLEGTGDD